MSSEIEIMGAYFPGWLIAGILGIILAGLSKVVFDRIGLQGQLVIPVVVYPALAFLWAGLLWMTLFN